MEAAPITDEQMYAQWIPFAKGIAGRMARKHDLDWHTTEEIIQHAASRLAEIPQEMRDQVGYVKRCVTNACIDGLRKVTPKKKKKTISLDAGWDVPGYSPLVARLENKSTENLEIKHFARQLWDAITPLQQRILTLRFGLDGAKPIEDIKRIASHVDAGIGIEEVKHELTKALTRMRRMAA